MYRYFAKSMLHINAHRYINRRIIYLIIQNHLLFGWAQSFCYHLEVVSKPSINSYYGFLLCSYAEGLIVVEIV